MPLNHSQNVSSNRADKEEQRITAHLPEYNQPRYETDDAPEEDHQDEKNPPRSLRRGSLHLHVVVELFFFETDEAVCERSNAIKDCLHHFRSPRTRLVRLLRWLRRFGHRLAVPCFLILQLAETVLLPLRVF